MNLSQSPVAYAIDVLQKELIAQVSFLSHHYNAVKQAKEEVENGLMLGFTIDEDLIPLTQDRITQLKWAIIALESAIIKGL